MEASIYDLRMKNFWYFLFCCCLCSSVKAVDLDPALHAYLSDRKYTKNIEVTGYLVTKDQLAKLFSEKNGKIVQKTNKELFGREVFLLVRCKNFGDYRAFDTLKCTRSSHDFASTEVMMMPGYMKSSYDTVLPGYSGVIPNDGNIPVLTFEWKDLYTI
jgi:hypothetical protein